MTLLLKLHGSSEGLKDTILTRFKGTFEDAEKYYVNNEFTTLSGVVETYWTFNKIELIKVIEIGHLKEEYSQILSRGLDETEFYRHKIRHSKENREAMERLFIEYDNKG